MSASGMCSVKGVGLMVMMMRGPVTIGEAFRLRPDFTSQIVPAGAV